MKTLPEIHCSREPRKFDPSLHDPLDERSLPNQWHSHSLSENRRLPARSGFTPWLGRERSLLDSFGACPRTRIRRRDAGRQRTREFQHAAQRVSVPGSRGRCRWTHPRAQACGSGSGGPFDGRHDRGRARESNRHGHPCRHPGGPDFLERPASARSLRRATSSSNTAGFSVPIRATCQLSCGSDTQIVRWSSSKS